MNQWWLLVGSITLLIVSLLTTVVFCFWFVYLFDAIRRKWKFYKNELRCLQQGTSDVQQQTLAYNAKTELVKNILLFFLNLTEWMAFIFARVGYIYHFIHEIFQEGNHHQSVYLIADSFFAVLNITTGTIKLKFSFLSFLFLTNIFFVMSIILVASLCMYLAARIGRKSWIKSNRIPHLIVFFLVCSIINHLLASFCSSLIVSHWITVLLVIASVCIALKQYRKLKMVMGWTIVDLYVCRKKTSMAKQVKIRRRFTRLFTLIWTGIFLLSLDQFLGTIIKTLMLIFRQKNTTSFDISLCESIYFLTPTFKDILFALFACKFVLGGVGASFIFISYIGYGLFTMCIMLWRLYRGKTEYKTHYHNEIYAPLI